MTTYRFIEPLDVLYLRGNRLFDGAGAYGEALMPPWPSLAAGALRSRLLADAGVDFGQFAAGQALADPQLAACLGTPKAPGTFRITLLTLAKRNTNRTLDPCFPLPADVTVIREGEQEEYLYLQPAQAIPDCLHSSYPLPALPLLRSRLVGKPVSGRWLTQTGLAAYLAGQPLQAEHLIETRQLWQLDARLGITLDGEKRSAADSMLYTADAVALAKEVGFLVGVAGAEGLVPAAGLLRFGGDGRGAAVQPAAVQLPTPDWARIAADKKFRLVLATPGLFPDGWQLPGLHGDRWHGPGVSARLVAACVSRAETVSGWDVAQRGPKAAERVAPVGSVYFFDQLSGAVDGLQTLLADGLWPLLEQPDAARRAEGFNHLWIAAWPQSPNTHY